jgi:non-specific serine/threonine protein kinase/serine/threonine-protein kinase
MTDASRDDRLLHLARRLLDGEAIDWKNEAIAESEVREGLKKLQHVLGRETETAKHPPRTHADRFVGDFRIVRKLGEGGMGVVYEAEQQHPKRAVALKVIRGGVNVSKDTLKLFKREVQTLARLNHVGIAQLYEAGATDDGMHFFAMELVRGVPLSDWLRSRPKGPITPAEIKIRLGIFRKVCDAVAYAHQKGVIHRDLKPGNILIPKPVAGSSIPDAVPEVKILDFGLARITDSDVQATTFLTDMGKVQGTLPYMSPEQVRGNSDEIDLRTDVYSLGVLIYEMVTGHLPYDVAKAQIPEAVRIICEEPAKSISASFTGTRRLDADVITIAGKCLEKEPARRYQSAAALGEDVQRYLSDQPILARPPSAAYQFRKLVLRHKGPFAAATGAFVLLAIFAGAMTVQAARIASERDRANQERDRANDEAETSRRVSDFLEGLFKSSDPWTTAERVITPLEMLDKGVAQIELELRGQPALQARLMSTIGKAYRGLGIRERANATLERARDVTASVYGIESVQYAQALIDLEGYDNLVRAYAIESRILKPNDVRLARALYWVGIAKFIKGLPEGETDLQHALELLDKADRPDDQLRSWILGDLGFYRVRRQDWSGAVPLYRLSLEIRRRIYYEGHPDLVNGLNNLGNTLNYAGERQEARLVLGEALELGMRRLGPDHPMVGLVLSSFGELERLDGHHDRARSLFKRAMETFDRGKFGPLDSVRSGILTGLGRLAEAEGRLDESIRCFRQAYEIYQREPGISDIDPKPEYARVLRKAGRITEAERIENVMKVEATR